jgi:hypothetical protein
LHGEILNPPAAGHNSNNRRKPHDFWRRQSRDQSERPGSSR